jgi:tRNA U34 5-carboxymethylaminomethyl modifying GTPase MnmE/TrmE
LILSILRGNQVDYHEFLEFGMEKDEAIIRAREATEGVAEAMHWLREDIDGVIYMLDSTLDPFMQVNIMMIGIIESRKLPVIIVANKIDLAEAAPARIRSAFRSIGCCSLGLEGQDVESLCETMLECFGEKVCRTNVRNADGIQGRVHRDPKGCASCGAKFLS